MEIQNKNDELQKELIHARREISEKAYLQKTIDKFVIASSSSQLAFNLHSLFIVYRNYNWTWLKRTRNCRKNSRRFYLNALMVKKPLDRVLECFV